MAWQQCWRLSWWFAYCSISSERFEGMTNIWILPILLLLILENVSWIFPIFMLSSLVWENSERCQQGSNIPQEFAKKKLWKTRPAKYPLPLPESVLFEYSEKKQFLLLVWVSKVLLTWKFQWLVTANRDSTFALLVLFTVESKEKFECACQDG